MRYISIFSGIEAATVAWEQLGWTPVAFAEIDAFPSAVLAARYPDVPNLGDVTKVDWSPYRGAVDLVVGGSPCQSFSIAGKREGLAGASGLMWEYIRCVQEVMPSWFVWENVPGALTVERGRAFAQLLDSLSELGYGLAWRILDAQFMRVRIGDEWIGPVAQRRRRVFLVGHLGDMRACEVLFEPESLRWDNPSSREKREALTRAAGRSAPSGSGTRGCLTQHGEDFARALTRRHDSSPCMDRGSNVLFAQSNTAYAVRTAFTGANGCGISEDVAHTVDTNGPEATAYAFKVRCGGGEYITWDGKRGTAGRGALWNDQTAYTIAATQDQHLMVMVPDDRDSQSIVMSTLQPNAEIERGGLCPSLTAHAKKDPPTLFMEVSNDG